MIPPADTVGTWPHPRKETPSTPLLSALHCPYCGSELERVLGIPVHQAGATLPGGNYEIYRCACAEYPVVEGIPILQHLDGLGEVTRLIKEGSPRRALLQAMNVFRITWAHRTKWHQARYHLNCRRLIADSKLTFQDALQLVRKPQGFADYLFHRYANPSFFSAMTLLPLLERAQATGGSVRILDLGCGAGHSTSLISRWFPEASLVASDQDFISLYLAKRFMAPDAEYVCADVEVPSAFPDDHFDAVHCLDAFHYFKAKHAILGELRRVMQADALWLFPHLHNALADNITAGIPLAPEHYARIFGLADLEMFDEDDLIRRRCESDPFVGLPGRAPLAELNGAQTLAVVGGGGARLRGHESLPAWLRKRSRDLKINPIYDGRWTKGTLHLERRWPNDVFQRECRKAEAILPERVDLSAAELQAILRSEKQADDVRVEDLLCRFVLVPLPSRYSRRDLTAAPA